MSIACGRPQGGEGVRPMWTHVDRGEGVKNLIFCGRHKWITPMLPERIQCHRRTPDPWGRACDGLEGSGGCNFLSSYNGGSPRPTPLLLCLLHLCPTNFEVTWSPSTTASSGCQSDNGCLAAIRLTGLVGACNR